MCLLAPLRSLTLIGMPWQLNESVAIVQNVSWLLFDDINILKLFIALLHFRYGCFDIVDSFLRFRIP